MTPDEYRHLMNIVELDKQLAKVRRQLYWTYAKLTICVGIFLLGVYKMWAG